MTRCTQQRPTTPIAEQLLATECSRVGDEIGVFPCSKDLVPVRDNGVESEGFYAGIVQAHLHFVERVRRRRVARDAGPQHTENGPVVERTVEWVGHLMHEQVEGRGVLSGVPLEPPQASCPGDWVGRAKKRSQLIRQRLERHRPGNTRL